VFFVIFRCVLCGKFIYLLINVLYRVNSYIFFNETKYPDEYCIPIYNRLKQYCLAISLFAEVGFKNHFKFLIRIIFPKYKSSFLGIILEKIIPVILKKLQNSIVNNKRILFFFSPRNSL